MCPAWALNGDLVWLLCFPADHLPQSETLMCLKSLKSFASQSNQCCHVAFLTDCIHVRNSKLFFLKSCKIKGMMNERAKITADKKNSKHCAFILSLNGTAAICELILISSKEHHSLEENPFYGIKELPSWQAWILSGCAFMLPVLSNNHCSLTVKHEGFISSLDALQLYRNDLGTSLGTLMHWERSD